MQTETFENSQPEIAQQEKEFLDLLPEIATPGILKGDSSATGENKQKASFDPKPASNQLH